MAGKPQPNKSEYWEYVKPHIEKACEAGRTDKLVSYLRGFLNGKPAKDKAMMRVKEMADENDLEGLYSLL